MWGSASWGELIWGGAVGVPLLGPLGLVAMVGCLLLAGLAVHRRRRSGRPAWLPWFAAAIAVIASLISTEGLSATIDVPNEFTNGTIADADEVNQNFDTLVMESNAQDVRISALEATDVTTISAGFGLVGGGSSGLVSLAVDPAVIQRRVSGACPAGQTIQSINADGTVVCHTDIDTNTLYAAGFGLQLVGTTFSTDPAFTQSRVTGTCPVGSSMRVIASNGSVSCQPDADSTCAMSGVCPTVYGGQFAYPSPQTRTVLVGPERMIHRNGGPRALPANGTWYSSNTSTSSTGVDRYLDAAITEIPNGATVQSLTCHIYDALDTYEVGINLYECTGNCTSKLTGDWCYSGQPGGCISNPSAIVNFNAMTPPMSPFVVDTATKSYHLSYYTSIAGAVSCAAGCRFYDCAITYTTSGPQ